MNDWMYNIMVDTAKTKGLL